ncbi:MAG: phage tail tube protein [Prevotella sp.]
MAYVESTDLVRGEDMMLYVMVASVATPIAYATSNSLSYSLDTIDTSSKMSGDWKSAMPGQIGWTVSTDALISNTSGHVSFAKLEELMTARIPIQVKFGTVTDASAEFELNANKPVRTGYAIITSLEMTSEKGGICTSSITLQGNGELVKS